MATRSATAGIPEYRRPQLTETGGGMIQATWPERVFRFLLSDGRTVDVRSSRDDSDLRGVLLEHMGVDKIEGSVIVADQTRPT